MEWGGAWRSGEDCRGVRWSPEDAGGVEWSAEQCDGVGGTAKECDGVGRSLEEWGGQPRSATGSRGGHRSGMECRRVRWSGEDCEEMRRGVEEWEGRDARAVVKCPPSQNFLTFASPHWPIQKRSQDSLAALIPGVNRTRHGCQQRHAPRRQRAQFARDFLTIAFCVHVVPPTLILLVLSISSV